MALTTFGSYSLPPVKDQIKIAGHFRQAYATIENADGMMTQPGSGPLPLEMGEIDVQFSIRPSWLSANGYTGNFAGMETAIVDFSKSVLWGGQQTLTDTLHATAKSGKLGAAVTSRAVTAQAAEGYDIEYEIGASIATITLKFIITSPFWTYSDGTRVPVL